MQIFLVSKHLPIAQFVVVLRFFLSCMLPQITVPVTDKLVFACFPGFYGTAGCYTWRHVLFWAGVTAAGNKHCNENMIFLRRRKRFCLQLREKKERNKEWMMVESTFGDGPANFCEICPNGSSLGVIKKRKKKYNMHDMTSNQKHTKNDLLRLKNKSVDERKDFFFFFFWKECYWVVKSNAKAEKQIAIAKQDGQINCSFRLWTVLLGTTRQRCWIQWNNCNNESEPQMGVREPNFIFITLRNRLRDKEREWSSGRKVRCNFYN